MGPRKSAPGVQVPLASTGPGVGIVRSERTGLAVIWNCTRRSAGLTCKRARTSVRAKGFLLGPT